MRAWFSPTSTVRILTPRTPPTLCELFLSKTTTRTSGSSFSYYSTTTRYLHLYTGIPFHKLYANSPDCVQQYGYTPLNIYFLSAWYINDSLLGVHVPDVTWITSRNLNACCRYTPHSELHLYVTLLSFWFTNLQPWRHVEAHMTDFLLQHTIRSVIFCNCSSLIAGLSTEYSELGLEARRRCCVSCGTETRIHRSKLPCSWIFNTHG